MRSGDKFAATPGAMTSLDENTTPPTIRSFGIAARRRPPGSRKARIRNGRMFWRKARYRTTRECRSAQTPRRCPRRAAAAMPVSETGQAGRLQRADDDILRSKRGGIVRCSDLGLELGVSNAQRRGRWPSPHRDARPASRRKHHALPARAAPQNGCRRRPHRKTHIRM